MAEEAKTYYITKYTLTDGVIQEVCATKNTMHDCVTLVGSGWRDTYWRKEKHETLEAAQAQANKMRDAAIKACERKLAKLQNFEFRVLKR